MKAALVSLCLGVALVAPAGAAPILTGGTPAAWTSASGDAFWNNVSYDRNGFANVGVFLAGYPGSDIPGFYANSPFLEPLEWLGDGTATFVWDQSVATTSLIGVTSWSDTFWVSDGIFFFQSPYDVWRSDTLDGGRSHFALFRDGSRYYLGMEDATWTTSRTADWDYNDLIVTWEDTAVPEPGTLLLLGTGLVAIARAARRR